MIVLTACFVRQLYLAAETTYNQQSASFFWRQTDCMLTVRSSPVMWMADRGQDSVDRINSWLHCGAIAHTDAAYEVGSAAWLLSARVWPMNSSLAADAEEVGTRTAAQISKTCKIEKIQVVFPSTNQTELIE